MNDQKLKFPFLSFFDRLDKDVKGSLTVILILGIIKREEITWGYQIKKELQRISNSEERIKDSSLYTILNSLEKQYGLLVSKSQDRRRYYSLSQIGKDNLSDIFTYWINFVLKSLQSLNEIGISVPNLLVEVN
jgi:DNA-binding PadR family transcriptional regulator